MDELSNTPPPTTTTTQPPRNYHFVQLATLWCALLCASACTRTGLLPPSCGTLLNDLAQLLFYYNPGMCVCIGYGMEEEGVDDDGGGGGSDDGDDDNGGGDDNDDDNTIQLVLLMLMRMINIPCVCMCVCVGTLHISPTTTTESCITKTPTILCTLYTVYYTITIPFLHYADIHYADMHYTGVASTFTTPT